MTSFLPTIAKQLGYSTVVVGTIYSILPILSLIIKPIIGAIVDQFRVKKLIFLTFILLSGLTAFSLMFVPSMPLDSSVELNCNSATYLNVCPEDDLSLSNCSSKRVKDIIGGKFGCEVSINVHILIFRYYIFSLPIYLLNVSLIIYLILVKM